LFANALEPQAGDTAAALFATNALARVAAELAVPILHAGGCPAH